MGLDQARTFMRFHIRHRGNPRKCETPGYSIRTDEIATVFVRFTGPEQRLVVFCTNLKFVQVTWGSSKAHKKVTPKEVPVSTLVMPKKEDISEELRYQIRKVIESRTFYENI